MWLFELSTVSSKSPIKYIANQCKYLWYNINENYQIIRFSSLLPPQKCQLCDIKITSVVTTPNASILTNIYWDEKTCSIFLSDLVGVALVHYSYTKNKVTILSIDGVEKPAVFLPIAGSDDEYLISSNNRAFLIEWNGHSKHAVQGRELFSVPPKSLIDHVYVGPNSKLYIGNFGPNACADPPLWSLYGYKKHRGLSEYSDDFVTTVGGVVIKETKTYYHLDTCTQTLSAFRWNPVAGGLCK